MTRCLSWREPWGGIAIAMLCSMLQDRKMSMFMYIAVFRKWQVIKSYGCASWSPDWLLVCCSRVHGYSAWASDSCSTFMRVLKRRE